MSPETEPSGREHTVWERVCQAATGMNHHQAKAALDDARKAAEDPSPTGRQALDAQAEAEEWERITDTLADHAGVYDPTADPFVQGRLAARTHRTRTPAQRR
ncbi:hypothetical protein OHB54_41835 [Streptomyces sp. NBC_01007]|nr:hypothetical protein OHB54_41835 [Streptomyces sp. NBC_01007]